MFTHLHNHTEYSLLDGVSRIPAMVEHVKKLGMDSVAITDHGNLYGVVDFYETCKDLEIKPIIGCELYAARHSRLDHSPNEGSPHHLLVIAQDNTGYHNLLKLVTNSYVEGFYRKPRVDLESLSRHAEGLICLSGCASAAVPELLAQGSLEAATDLASTYRDIFDDRYFLELQRHKDVDNLDLINDGLIQISRKLAIPTVVTNDAHYVHQDDHHAQDLYICIQTKTNTHDPKRLRMVDTSYYVKSPDEMAQLFPDHPDGIARTMEIAQSCNVSLDFSQTHVPKPQLPEGVDADQHLANLCKEKFYAHYGRDNRVANARMHYELDVIRQTSFANYFLVVHDIIRFVRDRGIRVAVRGSAAASIVLFCTDVTDIDPLRYDLVFERFLNPERKEMPDIDLDFQDDRRDEVLHYVIDKYGQQQVAQIISFNSMAARAAIRDTGRAMAMSHDDVSKIANMVPQKVRTISDALQQDELQAAYNSSRDNRTLLDNAQKLEGLVRNVNTHAAGVLIADNPLDEVVPLQRPTRTDSPVLMTQYSMDQVAKLGLLKMDFLGLTSLTVLDQTEKLVPGLDLNSIPLDDPRVYEMLSTGNTTNVFQLESTGMQRYIRDLKPTDILDISAMIALYRPGPMEQIDKFIASKHRRTSITYPHDSFKEILDETYGIIVYQDQVLKILQQFAGYSMGAADIVRKAMGKKIPELMQKEQQNFLQGAQGQGYDLPTSQAIWNLIEPFAGYAFNKAHSVSYAMISYRTAYCKVHHPVEYLVSTLNCRMDSPDYWNKTLEEIHRLEYKILPPSVNASQPMCTPEDGAIRLGLAAVKNVGAQAVEDVVQNAPYSSIDDLCRRGSLSGLNRRTLEYLAQAGALDDLGERGKIVANAGRIITAAHNDASRRSTGQHTMFDNLEGAQASLVLEDAPKLSNNERARLEYQLLGVPLSASLPNYPPRRSSRPAPNGRRPQPAGNPAEPPPTVEEPEPVADDQDFSQSRFTPGPNAVHYTLRETGDLRADTLTLQRVAAVLLAHPGDEAVVGTVELLSGHRVTMVLDSLACDNSPELRARIAEVTGVFADEADEAADHAPEPALAA